MRTLIVWLCLVPMVCAACAPKAVSPVVSLAESDLPAALTPFAGPARMMQIVPEPPEAVPFTERLVLYDRQGHEWASQTFEAHYGLEVDAVDLDGDRLPEIVATRIIGPITGPAPRELIVLRMNLAGKLLEEVVRIPVAGQAGPSVGWRYGKEYVCGPDGCTLLRLVLSRDDQTERSGWRDYVPQDRVKLVMVGRRAVRLAAGE